MHSIKCATSGDGSSRRRCVTVGCFTRSRIFPWQRHTLPSNQAMHGWVVRGQNTSGACINPFLVFHGIQKRAKIFPFTTTSCTRHASNRSNALHHYAF